jgi:hypothetical protein
MVAITNYSTLVSAIQEVSENDGTEFLAYIPTAIDLEDLEIKSTGILSAGSPLLNKPSGYEYANYFNITISSLKRFLKKRQEDFILDYWPNSSLTDVPKYYGDASETQFYLAPTPTLSYPYEIKYVAKPSGLTSTNTTNYYVLNCPDILFYACMLQMAVFIKSNDQINLWTGAYSSSRDSWNMSDKRTRRDNGTKPFNPDNAPNTVTQSQ